MIRPTFFATGGCFLSAGSSVVELVTSLAPQNCHSFSNGLEHSKSLI